MDWIRRIKEIDREIIDTFIKRDKLVCRRQEIAERLKNDPAFKEYQKQFLEQLSTDN